MKPYDHSSGPWKQHGLNVRSYGGAWICTLLDVWSDSSTPKYVKMANARLIAAAPELLAALEWIVDDWEKVTERTLPDDHEAKAAIAKARGTHE